MTPQPDPHTHRVQSNDPMFVNIPYFEGLCADPECHAPELARQLIEAQGVLQRIADGCADTHTPQQHAKAYFNDLLAESKKPSEPEGGT